MNYWVYLCYMRTFILTLLMLTESSTYKFKHLMAINIFYKPPPGFMYFRPSFSSSTHIFLMLTTVRHHGKTSVPTYLGKSAQWHLEYPSSIWTASNVTERRSKPCKYISLNPGLLYPQLSLPLIWYLTCPPPFQGQLTKENCERKEVNRSRGIIPYFSKLSNNVMHGHIAGASPVTFEVT